MAGYSRNDTSNNIADGNVVNASDLDGEFDAIVSAFNSSTGHTHDGTSAEGAPIEKVGPVQDLVITATEVKPKTDNTLDLGTSLLEFKDLYLDGTANIDSLVADTADINAGSIDGVTLGTNSAVTSAVITTADINGGTIDGVTIGGASAGAGTFTNLTATGTTTLAGASTSADIDFGDNDKARFGDSQDLQIYHDGSNSYIADFGTGDLKIQGASRLTIGSTSGEEFIVGNNNDSVELKFDNNTKLATTSTGIDVTGTVTADGLTVDTNTLHVDATNNRVGIGTTSPAFDLDISTSSSNQLRTTSSGTLSNFYQVTSGGTTVLQNSNGEQAFYTGGSEAMRLDSSGNLLVGKTATSGGTTVGTQINSDGYTQIVRDNVSTNPTLYLGKLTNDGQIIRFTKDGTTVGSIGVQPTTNLFIGGGSGDGSGIRMSSGSVFPCDGSGNSADDAKDLGKSSARWQDLYLSGKITNDGSGGIQVDTSGNVGIGTTSPDRNLHIESAVPGIRLSDTTENSYGEILYNVGDLQIRSDQGNTEANSTIVFDVDGTERMRIDSSGNVGIGTTSPSYLLHLAKNSSTDGPQIRLQNTNTVIGVGATAGVIDFYANDASTGGTGISGFIKNVFENAGVASALTFGTRSGSGGNSVERMRINNGGNLLVNTTSSALTGNQVGTDSQFAVEGSVGRVQIADSGNDLAFSRNGANYISATAGTSASITVQAGSAGGEVILTNGATSWAAVSDERYKTDLVEITDASAKVSTLRAVTGRYKTDEKGVSRAFLIAQDVQTVLPEAVTVTQNDDNEKDNGKLMLSYTDTIPLLVAAIKELKSELDTVKAELATLKGV